MSSFRRAIPDFQTANPVYVGATVYAYEVGSDGEATEALARLYGSPRGPQTLPNPLVLDGDGKFERVPYIEGAVILVVVSATVGTHKTGVVQPLGTWRGTWAPGAIYVTNDFVTWGSADYPRIYAATQPYVARATIDEDIAAGDLELILNVALLDELRSQVEDDKNAITIMHNTVVEKAAEVDAQHTTSTEKLAEFRNGYYGAYAAPPATRPDGTPTEEGDSFLRTTAPKGLHYFLEGAWLVPSSDTQTLNNKLDKDHEGKGGAVHAAVTDAAAGFMTATMKQKLDGIQEGANYFVYSHPTGDGNRHVPATSAGDVSKVLKSNAAAGGAPAWASLGKADVGLNRVDNTSDAEKPISTATSNELAQKYDKRSQLIPGAFTQAISTATGSLADLEIRGAGGGAAAAFALHRPGAYAVYFGLDSDNQIAYGGWSLGAARRVLWDTNNFNPAAKADLNGNSGLNFYANNFYIANQGWVTDLLAAKAASGGNAGLNFSVSDLYVNVWGKWLSTRVAELQNGIDSKYGYASSPTFNNVGVTGLAASGGHITTNGGNVDVDWGYLRAHRPDGPGLYSHRENSNGAVAAWYRDETLVGTVGVTTTGSSYNTTSDGRLKPLREDFDPTPILRNTVVVRHNWLNEPEHWSYGVIAQDEFARFPNAITPGNDKEPGEEGFEPWSADYSKYVAPLMRGWQFHDARLMQLEEENADLRAQLLMLATRLDAVENRQ